VHFPCKQNRKKHYNVELYTKIVNNSIIIRVLVDVNYCIRDINYTECNKYKKGPAKYRKLAGPFKLRTYHEGIFVRISYDKGILYLILIIVGVTAILFDNIHCIICTVNKAFNIVRALRINRNSYTYADI